MTFIWKHLFKLIIFINFRSLIKNKDTPKEDDNNALKQDKTCETNRTSKDDKKSKVVKTSENSNTSIDDEPAKKKQKLDTNGIDVLKLVLSREGETVNGIQHPINVKNHIKGNLTEIENLYEKYQYLYSSK